MSSIAPHLPDDARLRRSAVLAMTGYSRTTLWRRIRAGQFPGPIDDGGIQFWTVGVVRQHLREVGRARRVS